MWSKLLGLAGTAATGGWSWLAGLAATLLGWLLKLATAAIIYWRGKSAGRAAQKAEANEDNLERLDEARKRIDRVRTDPDYRERLRDAARGKPKG